MAGITAQFTGAQYVGALLYAGAFGALLSGLQSLAHHAATPLAVAQIALGVALGWLLTRHERPRAAPLLPFDLLQRPIFTLSIRPRCAASWPR